MSSAREYNMKEDVADDRTDLQDLMRYLDNRNSQNAVDVMQTDFDDQANVVVDGFQDDNRANVVVGGLQEDHLANAVDDSFTEAVLNVDDQLQEPVVKVDEVGDIDANESVEKTEDDFHEWEKAQNSFQEEGTDNVDHEPMEKEAEEADDDDDDDEPEIMI